MTRRRREYHEEYNEDDDRRIKASVAAAVDAAAAAHAAIAARHAAASLATSAASNPVIPPVDPVPPAFPAWFGLVADSDDDVGASLPTAIVPGFTTGAAALGVGHNERADAHAARDAEVGPGGGSRMERHVDHEEQFSTRVYVPPSPDPDPDRSAPAEALEPRDRVRKGEALWIDFGVEADAEAAGRGIPSGSRRLGDAHVTSHVAGHVADLANQRSLAAAAAERRTQRRRAVPSGPTESRPVSGVDAAGGAHRYATGKKGDVVKSSVVPAYKAAARPSNRKLMRNALSHVCLAGAANAREREAALAAMDAVPPDAAAVFVVLFRENIPPLKYRALYALMHGPGGNGGGGGKLVKIHGHVGPATVAVESVACAMKFDSGTREFKNLASRTVTQLTAAITLASKK